MARKTDGTPLIEALAAGIAHEVRNPLNAVEINLRILEQELEQSLPDRSLHVYKVLESISTEVRNLDDFVTEFLRFARPPRLKPERVNVRSLLSDLATFISPQCAKRGVTLSAHLTEGPAVAVVDTFQVKQAILNLVLNALDATPAGGRIEIRTGGTENTLEIDVHDSGDGISREAAARMFEVFFTTREGGTGLGLPICKQIAESHGGTLEVRSTTGEGPGAEPRPARSAQTGTTARLTLPVGGP